MSEVKPEAVYTWGPDQVTTEMLKIADGNFKKADRILQLCQEFYRRGAFNMEHKDGAKCEAEDQGGWPACTAPAEFYVKDEHADGRRIVFCKEHEDSRFFSPKHLAPIYARPET
jgi:hypothetical protein